MKRSAWDHPKLCELEAALGLPRYAAVGLLESLWHFTGRFAPRGDIGRHTNAAIARFIGWSQDADFLINTLLATRWLDVSLSYRLVVHDWHDHADEATKKHLLRSHVETVSRQRRDGVLPVSRPPVPEPVPEPKDIPRSRKPRSRGASSPLPDPANGTRTDTWITPYLATWRGIMGGELPIQPSLRPLSTLRKEHGEEETTVRWRRYCTYMAQQPQSTSQFASAAHFAKFFGQYANGASNGATVPKENRAYHCRLCSVSEILKPGIKHQCKPVQEIRT